MKIDVYQQVTDKIVAALEAGVRPWKKSWIGDHAAPLRHNGAPYKGINVLLLGLTGFGNPYWMTYNQAVEYTGQVRKGEKATHIVFFKPLSVTDKATGDDKTIPMIRSYAVFNAEQIDGLPERFYPVAGAPRNDDERNAAADAFIAATGAAIRHGGDKAFYSPSEDFIRLPDADAFDSIADYYATACHELVHWTGHTSRLDRKIANSYGGVDYAREELVAELGAAFVCSLLGLQSEPREDHASYLASWLEVLREDKKAIFKAASAAQKAADFLSPTDTILELFSDAA